MFPSVKTLQPLKVGPPLKFVIFKSNIVHVSLGLRALLTFINLLIISLKFNSCLIFYCHYVDNYKNIFIECLFQAQFYACLLLLV